MKAFITGVTGQDGSYLAEFLLSKGYEVHAIIRRSSVFTTQRLQKEVWDNPNFFTYHGDLADSSNLHRLISKIEPDEIYNLGAQSHVAVSFKNPLYSAQTSVIGPITLLEAVKNSDKEIKYYQASSSEMFGGIDNEKLEEKSKFIPKSPYAVG